MTFDPVSRINRVLADDTKPAKEALDLVSALGLRLPNDHPARKPLFELLGAEGAIMDDAMLENVRRAWNENQPPEQEKDGSKHPVR